MSEARVPGRVRSVGEMAADDRPRERLLREGPKALRSEELLAILLRTGTAERGVMELSEWLLDQFKLLGLLRASPQELLREVKGLGPAKVATILAAMELGYRGSREQVGTKIRRTGDVWALYGAGMARLSHEEVWVVSLGTGMHILGEQMVYKGTAHGASVRIAELLREPVVRQAPKMLLLHNHPSGDPKPSTADISMTQELDAAATLMNIGLVDHVVLGSEERWVSLAEMGVIKGK